MRLTFKIAGAAFAVVALYLTAALAIGPDDANAHLCAVVDHLWSGAGTPCKTNLGVYAIRVTATIGAFCVIALIVDGVIWCRQAWKKREKKKTEIVIDRNGNRAREIRGPDTNCHAPSVVEANTVSSVADDKNKRAVLKSLNTNDQTGLPHNATFRYKGRIFYFIRHNYSYDENIEFRSALRDVYDCIAHHAAPITATYDGPFVQFSRNWASIIETQGAQEALAMLDAIEKKATNANIQLEQILEKRPYFRSDLQTIIGWVGPNDLRGAIHKYQAALKILPEKTPKALIVLALGEFEKLLEEAAKAHLAWIGQLNAKINGARDELEALARLE